MLHRTAVALFSAMFMLLACVAIFLFMKPELATLLVIASLLGSIAGKLYEPPRL